MSHFYGTINNHSSRTQATRCGHKSNGLITHAASWSGAVRTSLHYDEQHTRDMCSVSLVQWHGGGVNHPLYSGPVGKYEPGLPPPKAVEFDPSGLSAFRERIGKTLDREGIECPGLADAIVTDLIA
jgi:hypothetical protein